MKSKYFLLFVEDASYELLDNGVKVTKPYYRYFLADGDGKVTVRESKDLKTEFIGEQVLASHPRVEVTVKEVSGVSKKTNLPYNFIALEKIDIL